MRYPSNSGVLWKVVFGFLCIIDTEQTAQIRWNTTGLRCLCLQFHSSRIPTVRACIFVAMYYSHPCRLAKSLMAKQNCSHRANVICDGSPSRIRIVRRISFGITTLPRSSMRLTIPVAFISMILRIFVVRLYSLQYCKKYVEIRYVFWIRFSYSVK